MSDSKKSKVFWSDEEMRSITATAIETQSERPDLSGLSLLRAAMRALPEDRRRHIVALTQVPWFEESIKEEAARRKAEAERFSDPVLPEVSRTADELKAQHARISEHCDETEAFHLESLALLNQVVAMLALVERELRVIGVKIGAIPVTRHNISKPKSKIRA